MKLKIVEWNLKSISIGNNKEEKELYEKRKEGIVKIIKQLEADVVILTEVTFAYKDIMKTLAELSKEDEEKKVEYIALGSNNGGNGNNIVIAVSSKHIDRAIFEDFYTYIRSDASEGKIYKRNYEKRNHPDRLLVKIRMNEEPHEWLSILGIRMQNSGMSPVDKIEQIEALKWEIEEAKPDIVIGDFNWDSAINLKEYEQRIEVGYINYSQKKNNIKIQWKKSEKRLEKYNMWPDQIDDKCKSMPKSFKGATSPDRVLYKVEYECKCNYGHNIKEISDVKRRYYYDKGWYYNYEGEAKCISDHDMLIVEVPIMENKLERFLGRDYSENNHIRNFLKYWIKVLPTMPDYYNDRQNYANWRKVNDLDCLYFDGDLRADIMMSVWTPINWVASYLNKESGIKFHKRAKDQDDSCYYLKLLVDEQDKYLPGDNELVVLLDRFAELAEQRCNFMLLPNRAMNAERYSIKINGERVWLYDQVPSTLVHLFNKESLGKYFLDENGEVDKKRIREWVLREHLEHGFVDEYITQSKVIPLIDGVNPVKGTWPQKEDEIKEALEYMIAFLKERQNKLEA